MTSTAQATTFAYLAFCMREKNYPDILTKGQELSLHKNIKGI